MKVVYKIILFFGMFQLAILVVNSLGVFPNTFYSDIEMEELTSSATGPVELLAYFFTVPDIVGLGAFTNFTFGMLVFLFLVAGAAISRATQSWTPVVVVIICTSFIPMITKSYKLWNKLFVNWDSQSLFYLGLMIGLGIIFFVLFTIVETPTHGGSG